MRYADSHCQCTEDNNYYIFTGPCIVSGKQVPVKVPKQELFAYHCGKRIQNALVSLNADDREFLISGIGPGEWDKCIGDPNEQE